MKIPKSTLPLLASAVFLPMLLYGQAVISFTNAPTPYPETALGDGCNTMWNDGSPTNQSLLAKHKLIHLRVIKISDNLYSDYTKPTYKFNLTFASPVSKWMWSGTPPTAYPLYINSTNVEDEVGPHDDIGCAWTYNERQFSRVINSSDVGDMMVTFELVIWNYNTWGMESYSTNTVTIGLPFHDSGTVAKGTIHFKAGHLYLTDHWAAPGQMPPATSPRLDDPVPEQDFGQPPRYPQYPPPPPFGMTNRTPIRVYTPPVGSLLNPRKFNAPAQRQNRNSLDSGSWASTLTNNFTSGETVDTIEDSDDIVVGVDLPLTLDLSSNQGFSRTVIPGLQTAKSMIGWDIVNIPAGKKKLIGIQYQAEETGGSFLLRQAVMLVNTNSSMWLSAMPTNTGFDLMFNGQFVSFPYLPEVGEWGYYSMDGQTTNDAGNWSTNVSAYGLARVIWSGGVWIHNNTGTNINVMTMGNLNTAIYTNANIPSGYSVWCWPWPESRCITNMSFPLCVGDSVQRWDAVNGAWIYYGLDDQGYGPKWYDEYSEECAPPTFDIKEAFLYYRTGGGSTNWQVLPPKKYEPLTEEPSCRLQVLPAVGGGQFYVGTAPQVIDIYCANSLTHTQVSGQAYTYSFCTNDAFRVMYCRSITNQVFTNYWVPAKIQILWDTSKVYEYSIIESNNIAGRTFTNRLARYNPLWMEVNPGPTNSGYYDPEDPDCSGEAVISPPPPEEQ